MDYPELKGVRVLVVEDTWPVGKALKSALEGIGMLVAGPVATVADAERLLAEQTPDLAVVDINLKGEFSYGLIDQLHGQGVRVVVLTGYTMLPKSIEKDRPSEAPCRPGDFGNPAPSDGPSRSSFCLRPVSRRGVLGAHAGTHRASQEVRSGNDHHSIATAKTTPIHGAARRWRSLGTASRMSRNGSKVIAAPLLRLWGRRHRDRRRAWGRLRQLAALGGGARLVSRSGRAKDQERKHGNKRERH